MKAFLKSSDGLFVLRPKITTVGRHEDSDIVLKSLGVEDHHAAIEFSDTDNSFVLRDFNSAHGTYVNDCHVQNAAVRVSPGDTFRFGSSGALFELMVENAPQVSCPPVNRRAAWPGQLQIVTETKPHLATVSQFPFLQSQRSPPLSRSRSYVASGTSPHPPLRKRPINAWGRPVSSPSFSPDPFSRPPAAVSGSGAAGPLTKTPQGDALLKEKDEVILKMGNEISRLSGLESESNRKDMVIANLQEELLALTEKMATALAKKDAEFHQKLVNLDQDVGAKAEEIKVLKEQISNLQRNTSEVLYHSLSERDVQIAHWKHENESLKKSQSLTTGLVTSLQKDVTAKEQRVQELKMDAERLRRESREKDNQLAHLAAQCSRIKEEMKRDLRDKEISAYQNQIQELELQVKRSEDEIQKCHAEQETLSKKLVEKTKAEGELKQECERRSQQLQEMGRRERLLKSDMEQAGTQAQHFRSQIIEMLFSTLSEKPPTNQQIFEKIKQIQDTNREHCQREKFLREEISLKTSEMKEVSDNVELLKKSLDGVQAFLRTSYCSSSLRKEICNLQNLCLTPPALQVWTSAAEVLGCLLSWVEAVEHLLQDVGLDISGSDKGMMSYMKKLRDSYCNTMSQLQTLQTQVKTTEETQHLLLKEKLNEQKEKLEEEFQKKERALLEEDQKKERALLEEEKEKREILESMAALEKKQLEDTVEEEKEKVQNLETQIKRLTEVIEDKTKSEGVLNTKLKETLESLEVADKRKTLAEEGLAGREKRLKSLENENAVLNRKHQAETAEYKEQIKQHSRTIVNLESKMLEAVQQAKKVKEENVKLQKQLEEKLKESPKSPKLEMQESPKSSRLQEVVPCADGTHIFMKEELAAAKREILSHQAVVWELKKELSEARARMSDVIGELNEKQKMELEQKRSLIHNLEHELGMLREKLYEMSRLVDQKDADLKTTSEELRNSREKLKQLKTELKEKASEPEKNMQHKTTQTRSPSPDEVPTARKVPSLDLADLGARCKGSRHEETILRQKDALAELRKRIKMLEKVPPLGEEAKMAEPLIVLKKGLTEKSDRKAEKESVLPSTATMGVDKRQSGASIIDPNVTIERTARLEMADALDLSENTYLNLIRDLASLVNVKELMGAQTIKYLPQDEREKVGTQRQKDLELLFDKISKLKNRLRRKEELLQEYDRDVGQLRANKQTLQACQSEMARLADKIYQKAEENALLKEDLRRTKLQLSQEKRVNRALKQRKTAVKKKSFPDNQKTVERPAVDHTKSEPLSTPA
ncbi:forkhead-associated domain-containing protein 1 isoform X2 [Tiliqua scincoides]|uniref:forkhead-associated domain-containing protein 1 isoform X2 n=1 Tax=Tiliqua scincoides TaxID=71010 RepID=UPI003462E74C